MCRGEKNHASLNEIYLTVTISGPMKLTENLGRKFGIQVSHIQGQGSRSTFERKT